MAIIGKIRDKSWLILIIVGGALVAFVAGDYFKGNPGGVESKYGFGTVYGEKVDIDAFNNSLAIADENSKRTAQQQQQQPQPVNKDQVWNSFVQDIVLQQEFAALGIFIGPAEFDAYIYGTDGFTVMPDLAQNFMDSTTGVFNANLLRARLEEMESSEDAEIQKQWEDTKTYYTEKRKREKYFEILKQGIYVTNLEAKEEYIAQKEVKNISYVLRRFAEIKEAEIDAPEEKLLAYFEEHKGDKKYENKTSVRELKYIDIPLEPSGKDSSKFNAMMEEFKTGITETTNDSLYVLKNSDLKFYTSGPYSTSVPATHANAKQHITYPKYLDSAFTNAQLGDVIGPYQNQGVYNIAKVIGFTRDTINARHILLPVVEGNEAAADATADSILGVINSGNFVEFVNQYSTDTGSKIKGGELGDFFFSNMVQPFAVFCTESEIGEIGRVRSQFGIHIIEVLDRKGPNHPRVALIQKTLKPSQATIDITEKGIYDLLYELDGKLSSTEDLQKKVELFDTTATSNDLFSRPVSVEESTPTINGFSSKLAEDKLLELAFTDEAKVGDLVNSPVKDGDRYIIAVVSSIKTKGETKYDDVKLVVKADYIKEQIAERLKGEMMKAKTLEGLTSDKIKISKAEITFASPQITGAGFEPEVVGALFSGLKDGQMTTTIVGKQGVYVIRLDNTVKAPVATDYEVEKGQLLAAGQGQISGAAGKALVEKAEVVDNRRFFAIGIRR